ncbi:hypothetical protein Tco_0840452 [Tanacetum coccineum]|uniref:Uncharacterized protein n=1 Tax=Tanacetum coccineum TaxID=301880 RepID=A0ABQ5ATL1_9ASTR
MESEIGHGLQVSLVSLFRMTALTVLIQRILVQYSPQFLLFPIRFFKSKKNLGMMHQGMVKANLETQIPKDSITFLDFGRKEFQTEVESVLAVDKFESSQSKFAIWVAAGFMVLSIENNRPETMSLRSSTSAETAWSGMSCTHFSYKPALFLD